MSKHLGRIVIAEEMLLSILDYPSGRVRAVNIDSDGNIVFTIEHYEMPLVEEGDTIPVVTPVFIRYNDGMGNSVAIRQKNVS